MSEKHWFPLESNPEVMNNYVSKLGLNTNEYSFHDVYSTEDWALEMVPRPVSAVLLLFPITQASEEYSEKEQNQIEEKGQELSPKVHFIKQTIGNACGTIGILHAIANAHEVYEKHVERGSYLDKFIKGTKDLQAEEIATYLENDEELEETHVEAATEGQSEQVEDVDAHFICFSIVDDCLYELDGRKRFPINHGSTSSETFLEDTCRVIQGFMDRNPGEVRFTMVAFAKNAPNEEA